MAIETSASQKVSRSEEAHQPIEKIAPPELRLVELGIDVVMVEDKALAGEQLEEAADQEDEVRRVTGVDDIEPVRADSTLSESTNSQKSEEEYSRR